MKILLANIGVSEKDGEFVKNMMQPVWKKNLDLVKRPDTELVLRSSEWGIIGMEGMFNPAMNVLNKQLIFHLCKDAEAQGFDAVMITCFGDPYLQEVRSFVNIPVIGIGEATMKMATMMGKRFGIVHVNPVVIEECRGEVASYGMSDYLAGIIATPESGEEQVMALKDAHGAIKTFIECGRKLIEMGAEVLIPGCGLMSPSLRVAPQCEEEYPNGLTEVDGVPVMDILGCGLKYAEMMVDLKKSGSNWISRKGVYALPTKEMLESGYMTIQDERIRYWDIVL